LETVIIGDSCSDLPAAYIREQDVPIVPYPFTYRGQVYYDDFGQGMSYGDFYAALRAGEAFTTSQANVHVLQELFRQYVSRDQAVIFISFSSALSNTCNNAILARQMVLEEFSQADISVVDSRSASLGEGLLLQRALEMRQAGSSKAEIVSWLERNKLRMNHWFTVDDLDHLRRGGRVSSAAAFIGTVLDIKPVLHVNNEGRLIPVMKVRGRKRSVHTLADTLARRILRPEDQTVAISHGDCLEEALFLRQLILDKIPVRDVLMNPVGPVIGAHTGPGVLSLFFMGPDRE